ncbi:hypothetical protein LINGRAHAP2_LOCUS15314 [Linum grandiflorum]
MGFPYLGAWLCILEISCNSKRTTCSRVRGIRPKLSSAKARSSMASFSPNSDNMTELYNPASEIGHPPVYRATHIAEYLKSFKSHGSALFRVKLRSSLKLRVIMFRC